LVSLVRELFHTQETITGDVVLRNPDSFLLVARMANGERWESGEHVVGTGLDQAACELAEGFLKRTNPQLYGALLIHRQDYSSALQVYLTMPLPLRDNTDVLVHEGIALRGLERFSESDAIFRELLRLDPRNADAHLNLANSLIHQGRTPEAISELKKAESIRPSDPRTFIELGNAFYKNNQIEEALHAYQQAIDRGPDDYIPYFNRGFLLNGSGRFKEAIPAYETVVFLAPHFAMAHNNLCDALDQAKRYEKAIVECKAALSLLAFPDAMDSLGMVLLHQNQMDDAISWLRKALALKPDYPFAHEHLIAALRGAGRKTEAAEEMRRFRKLGLPRR
jgi:tetratricopeptide (TPR) repeat protein